MLNPTRPLLVAALVAALALSAAGCSKKDDSSDSTSSGTSSEQKSTQQETTPAPTQSPGGAEEVTQLKIEDLVVGTGTEAKAGNVVTVNYTGWLTDGTKFDSSLDRNKPFTFPLGAGQVIPGWDQGVQGMKVGGKRKLTIPPDLGYGSRGVGPIPPNATLVFEVELLDVQ